MSRWTENKYKFRNNSDTWIAANYHLYRVETAQAVFTVRRRRLDYKQTIINLKNAGYTDICIVDMGRDVTF